MSRIAFYISNHGFGHAARNIPIIESLLGEDKNLYVSIKTGNNLIDFMGNSLDKYDSRISYYPMNTDVGLILKPGTMEIDKEFLLEEVKGYISKWDMYIEQEKEWITYNQLDLIVSDIVPWIFKSARLARVKSIFISNFTWAEIYKELLAEKVYEDYLQCYQEADLALLYPLAGNIKGYFKTTKDVGLSCRNFHDDNVNRIKEKYNKPILYVSVGRSVELEQELNVEGLPYQFIYTVGVKLKGKNTELLPINIDNIHDYIKAADYVITKAGWGTVAEAICAHKPMLVLRREDIVEDRVTLRNLLDLGIALPITIDEINAIRLTELLEQLNVKKENYQYISDSYRNCSIDIAKQILDYLLRGAVGSGKKQ